MASGVFRRRWFPKRLGRPIVSQSRTLVLDNVEATSARGSFTFIATRSVTGRSVTTSVTRPTPSITFSPTTGVTATSDLGTLTFTNSITEGLNGEVTTSVGSFEFLTTHNQSGLHVTTSLTRPTPTIQFFQTSTGLEATSEIGVPTWTSEVAGAEGQYATAQFSDFANYIITRHPTGLHVTSAIGTVMVVNVINSLLTVQGVHVQAAGFFSDSAGAGGGGGGSAGIYGSGKTGTDGFPGDQTGGTGGNADSDNVLGATTSGAGGESGTEFDGTYGSGSGGAGGAIGNSGTSSFTSDGSIFLAYTSSDTNDPTWVAISASETSPFTMPSDWTNTNSISLVGAGCGSPGETVTVVNSIDYSPGQSVSFSIATECSPSPTTFDVHSADSGDPIVFSSLGHGGDGGYYGGGGGGGTGGGAGRGAAGLIWIQYLSSDEFVTKTVTLKVSDNPFKIWAVPSDWSDTNNIVLIGAGGNGEKGTPLSGGDGGGGGGATIVSDTSSFTPNQILKFHVAPGGSAFPTTLGQIAAPSGANGGQPPPSFDGLLGNVLPTGTIVKHGATDVSTGYGIAGRGGSLTGGFNFQGGSEDSPGLEVVASVGEPVSTAAGRRTFWIAGIEQRNHGAGLALFPTSEDLGLTNDPYVIGSSQFYTIGEVHWNGEKKVQGTDWELVDPFTHIVRILVDTSGIGTPVTFIYYRWDIGVRAGFKVTSYPIKFAFNRTSIIAERVPPKDAFFTVSYTSAWPGGNPTTLFARHETMLDDILESHTLYDGDSGFETYRPAGYRVFDTTENLVFEWDGAAWGDGSSMAMNTMFYSKRQRGIYVFNGTTVSLLFKAGDTVNGTYPETLTYPSFGEGIGRNLLEDAFSNNASVDYPSSYQIAQHPGLYDEWLDI